MPNHGYYVFLDCAHNVGLEFARSAVHWNASEQVASTIAGLLKERFQVDGPFLFFAVQAATDMGSEWALWDQYLDELAHDIAVLQVEYRQSGKGQPKLDDFGARTPARYFFAAADIAERLKPAGQAVTESSARAQPGNASQPGADITLQEIAAQLRQLASAAEAAPRKHTLVSRRQLAGKMVADLPRPEQLRLIDAGLGEMAAIMSGPVGDGLVCEERWKKVLDAVETVGDTIPGLTFISRYPPLPWSDEQGAVIFAVECRLVAGALEHVPVPPTPEARELYRRASVYLRLGRAPCLLEPEEGSASAVDRLSICLTMCLEVFAAWAGASAGDKAYFFTPGASAEFNAAFILNNLPFRLRTVREHAIESAPAGSRTNVQSKLDPMIDAALELVRALQIDGRSRAVNEVVDARNEAFRDGPWLEPLKRLFAASEAVVPLIAVARQSWGKETGPPSPPVNQGISPSQYKPPRPSPEFAHAEDFTWVIWCRKRFAFSPGNQASTVRALWDAWEQSGRRDDCGLGEETLREKVGSNANDFRMVNVFRDHPAFGSMICRIAKGVFALRRIESNAPKGD